MNAKELSEAIRMKRKKVKEDGLENMVDTAPGPQMNPQDILNLKQKAQMEETMDLPEKIVGADDPADPVLDETQEKEALKRRMDKIERILYGLKVG